MTQQLTEQATESVDELGPVDWMVVEFPGSRFKGEIAPILDDLVERGTVRVLDLLLIRKDEAGALEFFELSDLDESEMGSLRAYETELSMLLSEDDVTAAAAAVEPGSTAALLVWENRWAAPFGSAVRRAGGQLEAVLDGAAGGDVDRLLEDRLLFRIVDSDVDGAAGRNVVAIGGTDANDAFEADRVAGAVDRTVGVDVSRPIAPRIAAEVEGIGSDDGNIIAARREHPGVLVALAGDAGEFGWG